MFEKAKRKNDRITPQHEKCVICGSQDYEWGRPEGPNTVRFRPYKDPRRFGGLRGGMILHMRMCRGCGNAQTFIKYQRDLDSLR